MGWDVHPDSFRVALLRAAELKLPLLVTENGTSMAEDERRWRFIADHLAAMHQAIASGAKVLGYCYWSLLDNFEWAHGFGPRFGLIEMDYATQERRIRPSALKYAEVCRTNRLSLP
jgi:beta-glucosidase